MLSIARVRGMDAWFVVTWTPAMPNPPVTFASMRRYAGEKRKWEQRMKPETPTPLVMHCSAPKNIDLTVFLGMQIYT
jgi:hypothetical protein